MAHAELGAERPTRQPDFGPTQVHNLEELHPGLRVIAHRRDPNSKPFDERYIIMDGDRPFRDSTGSWYIWALNTRGMRFILSLSSYAVAPYGDGRYSPTNWLEDESKKLAFSQQTKSA